MIYRQGKFQERRWRRNVRGLLLPDIHIPVHDWRKIEIVLECAADIDIDFVVQFGDLFDMDALGRWSVDAPGDIEGERLVADVREGKLLWQKISNAVRARNPDCALYMLEGNHEWRLDKLAAKQPYLKGALELPDLMDFDALGIQWIKSFSETAILRFDWSGDGEIFTRVLRRDDFIEGNGIAMIHGWFCNVNHAKKTSERYGRWQPIIYGHGHDVQVYTPNTYGWPRPYAASLGHLRLGDPGYVKSPDRWQPAFGILDMSAQDVGVWNLNIVNVNEDSKGNSHFFANGKHYKTKPLGE